MWFSLLLVLLLTGQGFSQCFTGTGCTGDTLPAASQRECCIATNDGLSYRDGGSCNLCIVHGFVSAVYNVDEEDRLDTMFRLNVKSETNFGDVLNIQGVITAMAGGTAENSDFEALQPISVANNAEIRLFTRNDETTLEYDDSVILTFTPDNPALIGGLEGVGEYIRASAIVNIIDDDQLQINFEESEYSITEGSILAVPIRLWFRNNQNAFNITFSPVTIATAEGKGLGAFINSGTIEEESRTTAGADFTDMTLTIEVPASTTAGAQVFELPKFFEVIDDDIDEIEQSFAIVAEIGPDVPDTPTNFSCFQRQAGDTVCFGRCGATEIRITDNDSMIIGFTTRSRTVSEGDTQPGTDYNRLTIDVETLRTSERRHTIIFRHFESRSTAIVQSNVVQRDPLFDALFGTQDNDPLEERFILLPGESEIPSLVTMARNEFRPEDDECYTIGIITTDIDGHRELFDCNDEPDATEFFCDHTICITNDDEPYVVAFVQTVYTVIESEGPVEVCVNLTYPGIDLDILDETVRVNVIDNEGSIYIPDGARLGTADMPDFLSRYPMLERTDYAAQTDAVNLIDDELITAVMRIVCYNQPIYDDMRLEVSEYAGLTLGVDMATVLTQVQDLYNFAAIRILDDDMAVVGLERTFYRVSEDVGVVTVCAVVYSPDIICPIEFPFSVSLSTADRSADSLSDYVALSVILIFPACETRQCVNVVIVDDSVDESEPDERFSYSVERTSGLDPRITLDPSAGEIIIMDDDVAVVGLERTFYSVSEDVGVVEVCAVVTRPNIDCPVKFTFTVHFSTINRTAESPMDYEGEHYFFLFYPCATRRCRTVNIVDDLVNEPDEMFAYTLEKVSGRNSRIILDPSSGEIVIGDNDILISVGFERTEYTTSEGEEVNLSITIFDPPSGLAPRPLTLSITTSDNTAVSPDDYGSVRNQLIHFNTGDSTVVHTITINHDRICEDNPKENFFSNLSLVNGIQPINVLRPSTRVVIDDCTEVCYRVMSVSIQPVSGTLVRISWSGRDDVMTSLQYTSYFTDTGAVMSRYDTVLAAGVTSTDVTLDDAVDGYEHNFTLHYIIKCDVMTPVTVTTFTFDKKHFQIQFGPIDYCLNWRLKKTGRIEDQLQSHLTRIIRERCSDCYNFNASYLKQGQFFCYGNPTTVTYRSTLINPFPTTNSSHLVGIIQSWVMTSSYLVLDGLRVKVAPDCPTCISSLDDDECVDTVQSDSAVSERISQVLSVCAVRELGQEICSV